MTEEINEKNLVEQLRANFPELENSFKERAATYEGEKYPSNYEVVGFIFKPELKKELSKGELTGFLRRAASFIERVCKSGDTEAINVIWIKIFEWLLFRPKDLDLLWPEFGDATKECIKDAAQRWLDAGRHFGRTNE